MTERKKAALQGCFVADAATMPLHWIYKNDDLKQIVGDCADPLFFATASCPYYNSRPPTDEGNDGKGFPGHYEVGQLSPYGEQALACLQFLDNGQGGALDGDVWAKAFLEWSKSYTGRPDHALKVFTENMEAGAKYPDCGADDNQAQSFGKIATALWVYGDSEDYIRNVEVCVRAHQNNDLNVAVGLFWARLLQHVVAGETIQAAYEAAKADVTHEDLAAALARTEANLGTTALDMLLDYGKEIKPEFPMAGLACPNPQATMGALHVVLNAKSFQEGITTNLLLGGDNCSRSTIIGAVLGAAFGVPDEYRDKVKVPALDPYLQ